MDNSIPQRICELLELRDDNKKVYLLSNNSKEAIFYPQPVHFYSFATETFEDVGSGCYDDIAHMILTEFDIPQSYFPEYQHNNFDLLETTRPFVSYTYTSPHFEKEFLHTIDNDPRTPSLLAIEVLFPLVSSDAVIRKAMISLSVQHTHKVPLAPIELEVFCVPKAIQHIPEIDASSWKKISSVIMQFDETANLKECMLDISSLIPQISAQIHPVTLLFKLRSNLLSSIQICSSEDCAHPPKLHFVYDTNFAANPQSGVLAHAIGDLGVGAVHPVSGHLTIDINDSIFDVYDKSIDIHHCYTSALAGYTYTYNPFLELEIPAFNAMKLGTGWRLNIMESIMPVHFYHQGHAYNGFLYVDGNGNKIYFKPRFHEHDGFDPYATLYEGISSYAYHFDPEKRLLLSTNEERIFDDYGRLISIRKNNGKNLSIRYSEGKIVKVVDETTQNSVDLYYDKNNFLTQISAYKQPITFSYKADALREITYPGGSKLVFDYAGCYRGPSSIQSKNSFGEIDSEFSYTYMPTCSGTRITSITNKKHVTYPCFDSPKK